MARAIARRGVALARIGAALAALLAAAAVKADAPRIPWIDEGDVPLASWSRSVTPHPDARQHPGDLVLFQAPNRGSGRRGVTAPGATLPLFGAKRGGGCAGRWLLVGPQAWVCSDDGDVRADEPSAPVPVPREDGLLREYFFVVPQGASAYADLQAVEEGASDRELEGRWGVAGVRERMVSGERWVETSKGLWIAARDLGAARPSLFHGEALGEGPVDLAWVLPDKAQVFPEPSPKAKSKDARARFQLVHVAEERGGYSKIGEGAWMLSRDLARPHVAPPPTEVTREGERWIDVELATQTLVAYEGARPVFATLVSTGRGAPGTDSATPPGVHRIWVKILASDMDNVERDDVDTHYSLEDVPYVQFFDKAVALHGTYWHRDFGRVKSHGCVNLAPKDARWLFDFTGPHLPPGWVAAYPESTDPGTAVRVR